MMMMILKLCLNRVGMLIFKNYRNKYIINNFYYYFMYVYFIRVIIMRVLEEFARISYL